MTRGKVLSWWLSWPKKQMDFGHPLACPHHAVMVSMTISLCFVYQPKYLSHCCAACLAGPWPPLSLQGRHGPWY